MGIPLIPLRMGLTYGAIAAVVEGTAPGNIDNLLCFVVIHFSIDRVQNLLGEEVAIEAAAPKRWFEVWP